MASTRPSPQRLLQIMQRQGNRRWGADYQPANRVVPEESPPQTRPSAVLAKKLGGRYITAQAKTERAPILLGLYNPYVFEIHEQKILFVAPQPHPLVGHPIAIGLDLPHLAGTVAVAERLGCLDRHPLVRMPSETNPGEFIWVPFPFIGDLLLFVLDDAGPYCVNWTVKKSAGDFEHGFPKNRPRRINEPPEKKELQRHEIEEVYHLDADIPTYRITLDEIDREVRINLLNLHYWNVRSPIEDIDERKREKILLDYENGIGSGVVQYELAKRASRDYSIALYSAKMILKQAIWSRRLRVDLFEPILDDQPLQPERRDVLHVYSRWFARISA